MIALMDIEAPLSTLEAVTSIVRHFIASEKQIRSCDLDHIHLQLEQSHEDIKQLWDEALAECVKDREEHAAALAGASSPPRWMTCALAKPALPHRPSSAGS